LPRTILLSAREKNTKDINIGHIILFFEGPTETYYFEHLTGIIKKNKYNDIEVEIADPAGGNSITVLNYADEYLLDDKNNTKYSNYIKYLIFDCDDKNVNTQDIINKVISSENSYEILVTNCAFEIWFLMHFEIVDAEHNNKIIERLNSKLVHGYKKASKGIISEIVHNGSVKSAIENAKHLCNKYEHEGMNICNSIKEMNPYTNVHILVEQLLAAQG